MLDVTNLSFSFSKVSHETKILDELSFACGPGSVLAIVGESGSGKSTLLKLLAGLLSPTSGTIQLSDNSQFSRWYQSQEPCLIPYRNSVENVCISREFRQDLSRDEIELASSLLVELGLGSKSQSFPDALSGGMKRRLSLAQSIFARSSLLLLDEPFAELDGSTRQISELVLKSHLVAASKSLVFATHDLDSAVALSTHILILSSGSKKLSKFVTNEFDVDSPKERRSSLKFLPTVNMLQSEILLLAEEAL